MYVNWWQWWNIKEKSNRLRALALMLKSQPSRYICMYIIENNWLCKAPVEWKNTQENVMFYNNIILKGVAIHIHKIVNICKVVLYRGWKSWNYYLNSMIDTFIQRLHRIHTRIYRSFIHNRTFKWNSNCYLYPSIIIIIIECVSIWKIFKTILEMYFLKKLFF